MPRRAVVAAVLALFMLAGCGGSDSGSQSASGDVVELNGLDQLRSAFAADEGTARLLLVLSPT